jgi:hypothetical protein
MATLGHYCRIHDNVAGRKARQGPEGYAAVGLCIFLSFIKISDQQRVWLSGRALA